MKSELPDDLLRAIGAVSALWAVLEYEMSRATVACIKKFSDNPSERMASLNSRSFAKRREVFEDVLKGDNVTPSVRNEGSGLLDRIKRVENDRHNIVHGMAEQIDLLRPEVLFSRTVGNELWFNQRFDVADIEAIADRIGDLHLAISKFALKLWLAR
jgi:hypothetical protein